MKANTFSVFGSRKYEFLHLFPLIIRQHYTYYPDWKIHLISDSDIFDDGGLRDFDRSNGRFINNMVKAGLLDFTIIQNGGLISQQPVSGIAMLWRLLPIWDKNIEYVFCRDLDSILTPRQLKYTTAFINSKKMAHGINDNNEHTIPLMGGMVGFNCKKLLNQIKFDSFEKLISSVNKDRNWWDQKGKDQEFLMNVIWPHVQNDFMWHDPIPPTRDSAKAVLFNDRSNLKDCVPGLVCNHVSPTVMERGDNFTNYIGASNCCNTTHGTTSLKDMIEFFDQHGNQEMMRKIREAN